MQHWEVLPCETGGVLGAVRDVRRQHGPGPRLGPTVLEPDVHRGEPGELAEDVLLAGFGGDGLGEELAHLAGVEVVDEAPDAGLAEAGDALLEVEPFADGGIGVVVDALLGSGLAEHIGQEGGVAALLVRHEFDERHLLVIDTGGGEFFLAEAGEAVVEEVELDPFLVETQGDGLEVEVGLHHVAGERAVGPEATSRGVGCRHRILGHAGRVVVCGGGVQWQCGDGGSQGGWAVDSTGGGGSASVWAVVGGGVVTVLTDDDGSVGPRGALGHGGDLRVRAIAVAGLRNRRRRSEGSRCQCQDGSNVGSGEHLEDEVGCLGNEEMRQFEKDEKRTINTFGGVREAASSWLSLLPGGSSPADADGKSCLADDWAYFLTSSTARSGNWWVKAPGLPGGTQLLPAARSDGGKGWIRMTQHVLVKAIENLSHFAELSRSLPP